MFPSRERSGHLVDWNVGRYLGDDGIDLIGSLQCSSARDLAPPGRRGKLELQRLCVVQGDIGHGIAGGGDLVAHQADDGEFVAVRPERHLLAECESGRAVDDHFVMAAHDVAPCDERPRPARPAQLETDEKKAQRRPPELRLDRLIGDGTGALHAIDPSHDFSCVARDARGLGERPVGSGLHHPQIGVRRAGLPQRIVDQAPVDAGDDDHDTEQQAQAKGGEHEAQEIVLDIAIGEIHRLCTWAISAARPTRSPLASCVTTAALSGRPPVIS